MSKPAAYSAGGFRWNDPMVATVDDAIVALAAELNTLPHQRPTHILLPYGHCLSWCARLRRALWKAAIAC
jgi:hypothetical protein